MTKRLLRLWVLLVVCGLVACQSTASPAPKPTSADTSPPQQTSTPVLPDPTATPVPSPTKEKEPAPTATTEAAAGDTEPPWRIPRVGESDWTEGTANAGLVVVEYSDFQ